MISTIYKITTPEEIAKRVAKMTGQKRTDKAKVNMSLAAKKRYANAVSD